MYSLSCLAGVRRDDMACKIQANGYDIALFQQKELGGFISLKLAETFDACEAGGKPKWLPADRV